MQQPAAFVLVLTPLSQALPTYHAPAHQNRSEYPDNSSTKRMDGKMRKMHYAHPHVRCIQLTHTHNAKSLQILTNCTSKLLEIMLKTYI